MNINIKTKIEEFATKYSNSLNIFSKEELIYNTTNIGTLNSFSRNLVVEYTNGQKVFNHIVNYSISRILYFLPLPITYFSENLELMKTSDKYFCKLVKPLFETRTSKIIKDKDSYDKLLYIVFFYLGFQRSIIYLLQSSYLNQNFLNKYSNTVRYGTLEKSFLDEGIYWMTHSFLMRRFDNYLDRINYNITNNITYIDFVKKKKGKHTYDMRIYFNVSDDRIFLREKNNKIYLFIYEVIRKKDGSLIKDGNKIISNNIYIDCGAGSLNNYSESLNDRLYILNIMSNILSELNIENAENIERKKKYIILFYYSLIFLMPFSLGTASIAEILFYSLWKYYIGENIRIRQNILFDVEALTLPFDSFYKNCMELDENEENEIKMTPYLYVI
jgi:hypothetical protein